MTFKLGFSLAAIISIGIAPIAAAHDNGFNHSHQSSSNGDRQLVGGAIGAVIGGVLGSQVAGRGARTEGSVLGAVLGGVTGAAIASNGNNSRSGGSYRGGTSYYGGNSGYYNRGYSQPYYNTGYSTGYSQPYYSQPYYSPARSSLNISIGSGGYYGGNRGFIGSGFSNGFYGGSRSRRGRRNFRRVGY